MGGKGGDTMAVNGGNSCGIGAVARGWGGTGSGAVPAGGGGTDSSAVATGAGDSDSGAPAASAPCLAVRAEGMAAAVGTSGDPFAFAAVEEVVRGDETFSVKTWLRVRSTCDTSSWGRSRCT